MGISLLKDEGPRCPMHGGVAIKLVNYNGVEICSSCKNKMRIETIHKQITNGATLEFISEEYNMPLRTIKKHLRKYGYPVPIFVETPDEFPPEVGGNGVLDTPVVT